MGGKYKITTALVAMEGSSEWRILISRMMGGTSCTVNISSSPDTRITTLFWRLLSRALVSL